MPDWSRRRALQALGTAAVASLAGCSSGDDEFEEPADTGRGDPVTEYTVREVRDPSGSELFWRNDRPTDDRPRRAGGSTFLGSADAVAAVSFADTDAAVELAAFVRETDFEGASVLLQSTTLEACRELRLRGVWRENDGLTTSFCTPLRPADAACTAGSEVAAAVAIRLPFVDEEMDGYGSQWSRDCDGLPAPVTPENTTRGGGA